MRLSIGYIAARLLLASSVGANPLRCGEDHDSEGSCKNAAPPTATVKNGTYAGVYNANYKQDFFLGMPFAQVCLCQPLFLTHSPCLE
jgi:hypothetical protein